MAGVRLWAATWRSLRKLFGLLAACGAAVIGIFKLGGIMSTAWTMLVSLLAYAAAFGLKFAIGFVLLLLVHELGHVLAIRLVGIRSSAPIFIPFVGAVVNIRNPLKNAKMEANVAVGGPAAGTLSALVCLILYLWFNSRLFLLLAYTSCLLNLVNLIPCNPLDGGKIVKAIPRKVMAAGNGCLLVLFVFTYNPFLLGILTVGLIQTFRLRQDSADPYYQLAPTARMKVSFWYYSLVSVLSITTGYTFSLI